MELRRGFEIKSGERVLVVEDVVTTGGSTNEVAALVGQSKGTLVGVSCIVDRSGGKARFDTKSFSVLQMDAVTHHAGRVPYVQGGRNRR